MVDKVFAICDYHMKGDVRRHSRHIYDIYKLLPLVPMDDNLRKLVKEVREVRAKNVSICHSAQSGVNVPEILMFIINNEIYRADYETVTYFLLVIAVMYWYCCKARYAKGLMLLFALIYLLSINVISDKNPFVIRNGSGRACSNVYITENGAGIWALTFSDAASACPVITR